MEAAFQREREEGSMRIPQPIRSDHIVLCFLLKLFVKMWKMVEGEGVEVHIQVFVFVFSLSFQQFLCESFTFC